METAFLLGKKQRAVLGKFGVVAPAGNMFTKDLAGGNDVVRFNRVLQVTLKSGKLGHYALGKQKQTYIYLLYEPLTCYSEILWIISKTFVSSDEPLFSLLSPLFLCAAPTTCTAFDERTII